MTDPKDDQLKTNKEGIPTKEPTPEPSIETPDEGVPPEDGEEGNADPNIPDHPSPNPDARGPIQDQEPEDGKHSS